MVQLNDEVFLKRLKEIVKYMRDRRWRTLMPAPKPESIEQYEERLKKLWDFVFDMGERITEMEAILDLVEASFIDRGARTLLEAYRGILEHPPWEMHTHPTPAYYATAGRPVEPKVSTEPDEKDEEPVEEEPKE